MATKGTSHRYGNTKGSNHQGKATEHINYAWAKAFNRGGLGRHFRDHGKELDCKTKEEYEAKALKFAKQLIEKIVKVLSIKMAQHTNIILRPMCW